MKQVSVCIVGLGHWGPNFIRAINSHPFARVVCAAESDSIRKSFVSKKFRDLPVYANLEECLAKSSFDAVIIATPTKTHAQLALLALESKKHVLVEKPLAHSTEAANAVLASASQNSLILMTGHVFLYNRAVLEMKTLIEKDELGEILYFRSVRTNLGPIRYDVNALWDLATHDISIANFLFGTMPESVSCSSFPISGGQMEDVAQAKLVYPGTLPAVLFVSWIDPHKVRQITVVGKRKMLVFDDMLPEQPLKIHDKGLDLDRKEPYSDTFESFRLSIHSGDEVVPKITTGVPLTEECNHFIDCVMSGAKPRTDGQNGLDVVRILEALTCSADKNGELVRL